MDSQRDLARVMAKQNSQRDIPARFKSMPNQCTNCEPEFDGVIEKLKNAKIVFSISPSHRFLFSFRVTTNPITAR